MTIVWVLDSSSFQNIRRKWARTYVYCSESCNKAKEYTPEMQIWKCLLFNQRFNMKFIVFTVLALLKIGLKMRSFSKSAFPGLLKNVFEGPEVMWYQKLKMDYSLNFGSFWTSQTVFCGRMKFPSFKVQTCFLLFQVIFKNVKFSLFKSNFFVCSKALRFVQKW